MLLVVPQPVVLQRLAVPLHAHVGRVRDDVDRRRVIPEVAVQPERAGQDRLDRAAIGGDRVQDVGGEPLEPGVQRVWLLAPQSERPVDRDRRADHGSAVLRDPVAGFEPDQRVLHGPTGIPDVGEREPTVRGGVEDRVVDAGHEPEPPGDRHGDAGEVVEVLDHQPIAHHLHVHRPRAVDAAAQHDALGPVSPGDVQIVEGEHPVVHVAVPLADREPLAPQVDVGQGDGLGAGQVVERPGERQIAAEAAGHALEIDEHADHVLDPPARRDVQAEVHRHRIRKRQRDRPGVVGFAFGTSAIVELDDAQIRRDRVAHQVIGVRQAGDCEVVDVGVALRAEVAALAADVRADVALSEQL